MRVLTTTLCYPTPDQPDQGIFVQRRAGALASLSPRGTGPACPRIDVRVVSPAVWFPILRPRQRIADQHHPLPVVHPRMLSMPVINWVTDGVSYARALERVITQVGGPARTGVDLIDAHFVYPDGVGAWLAGRRLGIPVVVTIRGKIVSLSRRTIRRAQIRAMLRGAAARIAVSESLAGWVRQVAGSDLHVDVIPNGVDASVYHFVERGRARLILGWAPNARYVLGVGHLQKLKGFDRLVSIMPAVRGALGDVRLVLAGSRRGERLFKYRLLRRIARCNVDAGMNSRGPCAEFVGPVGSEQLNLMYNAADLLVNASRSEGWSNAISESFAAGTPVVATNVGGNREQVCSAELGTVVPDGDARALAGAVIAALSRDWNRPLISAHGSARTWRHVAHEVYAVFARVLAARGAEGRADHYDPADPRAPLEKAAAAIEVPG